MGVKLSPDLPDEATPPVLPPVARVGGRERVITGSFELATGDIDNTNDRILLARIQSGDVITEFQLGLDTLDSGTTFAIDIGISDINGVDIDTDSSSTSLDLFQAAVVEDAAVALTDRRFSAPAEDTVDQRLWELVNNESSGTPFASDPSVTWFICVSVNVVPATAVAGTIFYRIRYVRD